MDQILCVVIDTDNNNSALCHVNPVMGVVYLYGENTDENIQDACKRFKLSLRETPLECTYDYQSTGCTLLSKWAYLDDDIEDENSPFLDFYSLYGGVKIALALISTKSKFTTWDLD